MKITQRIIPFLLCATIAAGAPGDVDIIERDSSNRKTKGGFSTGSGDRIMVVDDSNAQGSKVEGAVIGSGLSFDGTTLTATASGRSTSDLAGGTSIAANTDYFDSFAADRTNMTLWGTPTDGEYSTIIFDVTGATRSLGFNSTTVYRVTENGTSTGPWSYPVGNYSIKVQRMDGRWYLFDVVTDSEAASKFYASPDGSAGVPGFRDIVLDDLPAFPCEIGIAISDETTALTTGTAKVTFRMPYAMTLTEVRSNVVTAPTGATLTLDINETGTTVLSTKLTIDASEKTSETAATGAVISDSALADDAEITIDIDQIGSTVAGAGCKVWLIGTRTL